MSFDRGFIKWQPFNSLISNKVVLNNIKKDKIIKPDLFPEKIEQINHILRLFKSTYFLPVEVLALPICLPYFHHSVF